MKAVNLVPRESRRGSGTLSGLGIGTTAIFAALGLGLALSVAYVILANGVTSRKDQLAKLEPVFWNFWIGLLLVLVVMFARGGVLGLFDQGLRLLRRRR